MLTRRLWETYSMMFWRFMLKKKWYFGCWGSKLPLALLLMQGLGFFLYSCPHNFTVVTIYCFFLDLEWLHTLLFSSGKLSSIIVLLFFHVPGSFLCIISDPYKDPQFSVLHKYPFHSCDFLPFTLCSRAALSFPFTSQRVCFCWWLVNYCSQIPACLMTETLLCLFTELHCDNPVSPALSSLKNQFPTCSFSPLKRPRKTEGREAGGTINTAERRVTLHLHS